MEQEFSFSYLVKIIVKRFKILAIACIAALALSVIFSGPTFIKPRYHSLAVIYPSNISPYSSETRTEQLLQLCEASDIRDTLLEKFNLAESYEIDPTAPGGRTFLLEEYNSRVLIEKTRYESVQIKIEDEDPETAYLMVKELLKQVNLKARRLQRAKSMEIVEMRERQINEQRIYKDSLNTILSTLRNEKGLVNFDIQMQEVLHGYYRMMASASKSGASIKKTEELIDNLKSDGLYFKYIYDEAIGANIRYNELMDEYGMAINDIRKELTYVNEIISPEVPDKKSYPVRWLIVFTVVVSTALFCLVAFLFAENKVFEKVNG